MLKTFEVVVANLRDVDIWWFHALYIAVAIGLSLCLFLFIENRGENSFALLPSEMHNKLGYNWVVSILLFLLLLVAAPLVYVYMVVGLAIKRHWPAH